mgnify:CR=1 FL=1
MVLKKIKFLKTKGKYFYYISSDIYSYINIGGPVKIFFFLINKRVIKKVTFFLKKSDIKFVFLGNFSNTVISNFGYLGIMIFFLPVFFLKKNRKGIFYFNSNYEINKKNFFFFINFLEIYNLISIPGKIISSIYNNSDINFFFISKKIKNISLINFFSFNFFLTKYLFFNYRISNIPIRNFLFLVNFKFSIFFFDLYINYIFFFLSVKKKRFNYLIYSLGCFLKNGSFFLISIFLDKFKIKNLKFNDISFFSLHSNFLMNIFFSFNYEVLLLLKYIRVVFLKKITLKIKSEVFFL